MVKENSKVYIFIKMNIIHQSFSTCLSIMSILHLYPPEKSTRAYVIRSYLMYFSCLVLVPCLMVLYFIFNEFDMLTMSFNAAFLAETVGLMGKLLPFIKNGYQIKACINHLGKSYFSPKKHSQEKIIDDCIKVCRRNSTLFLTAVAIPCIGFTLKPLFSNPGSEFPISIWLPFDVTQHGNIYCIVYLFLVCVIAYVGAASATIDPLIGGLACHAATQLKVLKANLRNLNGYTNEEIHYTRRKKVLSREKIKQCIHHHNAILEFAKQFENAFSLVVFSKLLASIISICFCCLQVGMTDFSSIISFLSAISMCGVMAQIYFYSYYGTMLFTENDTLSDAIYMGRWYDYDVKSQKALIVMMSRSRKPLIIMAGKTFEFSLTTFTVIIKRSYSLLALLKNYQ